MSEIGFEGLRKKEGHVFISVCEEIEVTYSLSPGGLQRDDVDCKHSAATRDRS